MSDKNITKRLSRDTSYTKTKKSYQEKLSPDEIKQLASLPSMEELRTKIVGLLSSIQTKIVFSLKDSQSKIVRVINSKPKN